MKSKKSLILNIIFFGSLWGLLEATLGYGLQFLPPLVSGSVMFPIAATIMYWAYRNSESKISIIFVAMIAASIKAVNFLMPGLPPIKTYNPMISIMLQAVLVMGLVTLFEKKHVGYKLLSIALISWGWRALFIANIAINHALTGFPFTQLASPGSILSFIFAYGSVELAFLTVFFGIKLLLQKRINLLFQNHWLLTAATLIAALIAVSVPLL
jgi:hypothetical protein